MHTMPALYCVRSTADLHGYRDVAICWFVCERDRRLFGPTGSLGISYGQVITGYDPLIPNIYAEKPSKNC
jgi:hypothetical protein